MRKFHLRLSNLSKMIQPISGRAGLQTASRVYSLKLYYYSHLFSCLSPLLVYIACGQGPCHDHLVSAVSCTVYTQLNNNNKDNI